MAMAASRDRNVVDLNNFVYRYLDELGVTEEAKQEFVRKAKTVIGLEGFESFRIWMKITAPCQVLPKMEEMGPFEVGDSTDSASVNGPAPANKISDFPTRTRTVMLQLIDLNVRPDDQEEQPWEEIKQVADVEDEDSSAGKRKMIDKKHESDPIDLVKKKKQAAEKGKKKKKKKKSEEQEVANEAVEA